LARGFDFEWSVATALNGALLRAAEPFSFMGMTSPSPFKISIRLYCGDEIAMGPGKADLLDAIKAHGSISAAGRAMGMSYRRAWLLVDTMNRCWSEPLVATAPGVAHGGGARLTDFGDMVLSQYRAVQENVGGTASRPDHAKLTQSLRSRPRASQKG
jgi:molybdate transport system regulatory protein